MQELLPDFEDNKDHAEKVQKLHEGKLPFGMIIKAREYHVEISLLKHITNDGNPRVALVSYNQSRAQFDAECDNACELFYKLAKHASKQRLKQVAECENKSIDGKCPCGYCMGKERNKPGLNKLLRLHYNENN